MIHDAGALRDGAMEAIQAMCQRRGMPFEWAFVMDSLQAERDQDITIDTSQIRFKSDQRSYLIIDAPGHKEFLKNMITGAASADAAVLVVDAESGVQEQTRRHGYILHLLGVRQVVVAVNKMDLTGWSENRFVAVADEVRAYLDGIGIAGGAVAVVPLSARDGDNIATPSSRTPWYQGPTLVEALDGLPNSIEAAGLPLRLPVAGRLQVRPPPDHRRPDRERLPECRRHPAVLALQQVGQDRLHRGLGRQVAPDRPGRAVHRDNAGRADIRGARPSGQPHGRSACRNQCLPCPHLLAGPCATGAGQRVQAQAPHVGTPCRCGEDREDRRCRNAVGHGRRTRWIATR